MRKMEDDCCVGENGEQKKTTNQFQLQLNLLDVYVSDNNMRAVWRMVLVCHLFLFISQTMEELRCYH